MERAAGRATLWYDTPAMAAPTPPSIADELKSLRIDRGGARGSLPGWAAPVIAIAAEFQFHFDVPIAIRAIIFAIVMGFFGGLLPAARAARLQIAEATKG